jgi:hypothetical protein
LAGGENEVKFCDLSLFYFAFLIKLKAKNWTFNFFYLTLFALFYQIILIFWSLMAIKSARAVKALSLIFFLISPLYLLAIFTPMRTALRIPFLSKKLSG